MLSSVLKRVFGTINLCKGALTILTIGLIRKIFHLAPFWIFPVNELAKPLQNAPLAKAGVSGEDNR